jgi:hypothetical protein
VQVLTDPECVSPEKRAKAGGKKASTSMSLGESASYLMKSKYIRDLATLVIAYGMSINIIGGSGQGGRHKRRGPNAALPPLSFFATEVTWKSRLKQAFPGEHSIVVVVE